jgi:putative peptidoglycan lipid II flippase
MLGSILSLVGGLAINVVIAYLYGAGSYMDAYLTALVIPTYFQVVLSWNLSFILIPAFIEAEVKQKEEDAWALVGTFFWMTVAVLLAVALVGYVFSTLIVHAIAPGFQEEKAILATRMFEVLIFTTPFAGLSTLAVGIQNARDRFFWPSFAPAVGSFANVIVLIVLSPGMGPMALCWGFFMAMVCQACVTTIPILSYVTKNFLPLTDPRVKGVVRLVVPLVLFGMLTSFAPVAERYFASTLPDGQIAFMGYASKISNIFVLLLASSIATAIFPSMARVYAQDGLPGLSAKNDFGLRLSFALAMPTVLIVSAVAIPFVGTLFERGAFRRSTTLGVSQIIFAYLLGDILFRMVGNILQRSLFVLKNTITPPIVSAVTLVLYLLGARFFLGNWGYIGLVWAGTIRNGLGILAFWIILLFWFPKDHLKETLFLILEYSLAALGAYAYGRFVLFYLGSLPGLSQLLIAGTVSVTVYALMLYFVDKAIFMSILEVFGMSSVLDKFSFLRMPVIHHGTGGVKENDNERIQL